MRVARRLGWFDVDAMLASADAGQLDEWMAFEQLEPSGDDWERTSLVASTIHNCSERLMGAFGSDHEPDLVEWDAFVKYRNKVGKKQKREKKKALRALKMSEGL